VQFLRKLQKNSGNLRDKLTDEEVFMLLSGRGSLITLESVREVVFDKLGSLTVTEVAALFRRLDPSRSGVGNFVNLCALLKPFGDPLAFRHKEDTTINRALALGVMEPSSNAPCTRESLLELLGQLERHGELDLCGEYSMSNLRESFDVCPSKRPEEARESTRILLTHLAALGEHDLSVEDTKERLRNKLPTGMLAPSAAFAALDQAGHGYVSVSSLWQALDYIGRPVRLPSVEALARCLRAGWRSRRPPSSVEPLSFRDVCAAVLPSLSPELVAVQLSPDDAAARSELLVMASTIECPGCGARVQRDADAVGQRSSICVACGIPVMCGLQARDSDARAERSWGSQLLNDAIELSPRVREALFQAIEEQADAAVERERLIADLACKPLYAEASRATLAQALAWLAGAAPESDCRGTLLRREDFQVALRSHGLWHSDAVMALIWRRFGGDPRAPTAPLSAFTSELFPDLTR